jgi:hypothetical protein
MGRATNASETSYALLFASMVGLLAGLGLLIYGWPQPCGLLVPECSNSYALVIFGILIVLASVGLMTYSIRKHIR